MKLYLAGPLFTTAELAFNLALKKQLEALKHDVWLPQEHEPRAEGAAAIFAMDVEGMDWCDVVVANMDGPDPDSGTCWECGYAYKKKHILVYRTDFRVAGDAVGAAYNLMLTESADVKVTFPFKTPYWTAEEVGTRIHEELLQKWPNGVMAIESRENQFTE